MCGIVGSIGGAIEAGIKALAHRGPDAQGMVRLGDIRLGHTRLAILDPDPRSNQPFCYRDVHLVFNGEIWNFREIRTELQARGHRFQTSGDTEVVAAALAAWGTEALPRLNGMFALAWAIDGDRLYLARDRFGEVPLHLAKQRPFFFASELKALLALGTDPRSFADVPPGHWVEISERGMSQGCYYDAPLHLCPDDREAASQKVYDLLRCGAEERAVADVPVCTLLSGGIDSAAVAFFLSRAVPSLVAYTAALDPKAHDLRCARLVAEALGIELRVVPIRPPSAEDLGRVVRYIEMPHKAQVEIGWACLQLAERMRADGFKVTFSGEGSDELWASYGFAYHGLQKQDWHRYRKALFLSQARKNFVRCNKVFLAYGVECRLPFLHAPLVEYALSLTQRAVQNGRSQPKAVLQVAFQGKLPDPITRRPKVAFQDGLGLKAAIAARLADPQRFYAAEFANFLRGIP
jgi:asparagine synthase (glutamine-hydrolysing)